MNCVVTVLVLVLVAACQASADDYPVRPGGPDGPTGMGSADAGPGDGGDGDVGLQLSGKVCLLTDLRQLTRCDDVNAKGLVIALGTTNCASGGTVGCARTVDNGVFTITAPRGAGFSWRVTGDTVGRIVTSLMPFGTDNTIPAISRTVYEALLTSNRVAVGDQEGSVVVRVVKGVTPVAGVSASTVDPDKPTLYDGDDPDIWDPTQVQTGRFGVLWFPGVSLTLSPATITLIPQAASAVTTTATLENQAITFLTKDLQ